MVHNVFHLLTHAPPPTGVTDTSCWRGHKAASKSRTEYSLRLSGEAPLMRGEMSAVRHDEILAAGLCVASESCADQEFNQQGYNTSVH